MARFAIPIVALALAAGWPAAALALCTSDGVAQPQAVLERFVNADCEACWRDPATPAARADVLALDWIVPGARGDDAPLAMAESSDALDRLRALRRLAPAGTDAVTTLRRGPALALRLAQGEPVNDYIGAIIELQPGGAGGWEAWLLLVESLPAGAEGSPVARNLVRNVFRPDWGGRLPRGADRLSELRPLQIHEGARPERLRLVALVRDAAGRMRAIARTECRP